MAMDNLPDYISELINYAKADSFLEDLGDDAIEKELRVLVQNSVAYMMLTRLGIETAELLISTHLKPFPFSVKQQAILLKWD